ncbi:MAG: VOC family protein [Thermoleophilia bacterium]|nr:VOC family protein [Thermoleophilia bacterium]
MSTIRLATLSVPVSNAERALEFYRDGLGFTVVADVDMNPRQRWLQLAAPSGDTMIALVTWFERMTAGTLQGMVIEVDDLDIEIAELRDRGVPIVGDPVEAPWARFVTFRDPDGNGWVLQQRNAHPWEKLPR